MNELGLVLLAGAVRCLVLAVLGVAPCVASRRCGTGDRGPGGAGDADRAGRAGGRGSALLAAVVDRAGAGPAARVWTCRSGTHAGSTSQCTGPAGRYWGALRRDPLLWRRR